ncbi:MAG: hypothetical protein ACLQBQ_13525 [Smithella sp.]
MNSAQLFNTGKVVASISLYKAWKISLYGNHNQCASKTGKAAKYASGKSYDKTNKIYFH